MVTTVLSAICMRLPSRNWDRQHTPGAVLWRALLASEAARLRRASSALVSLLAGDRRHGRRLGLGALLTQEQNQHTKAGQWLPLMVPAGDTRLQLLDDLACGGS